MNRAIWNLTASTESVVEKESMAATTFTPLMRTRTMALAWSLAMVTVLAAWATTAQVAEAASPAWKVLSVSAPTNLDPQAFERQKLTPPSFGTYTLSFGANTTPALPAASTAAAIQSALNTLPSIAAGGGSVTVTQGPNTVGFPSVPTFVIAFDGGPLAGVDVPSIVAVGSFGGASVAPVESGTVAIYAYNVGGAATAGTYSAELTLPAGIVTAGAPKTGSGQIGGGPWSCGSAPAGASTVSCTGSTAVASGRSSAALLVPVAVAPGVPSELTADVSVSGGGSAAAGEYTLPLVISDTPAEHGIAAFFAGAFDENGNPETRAGAHPFTATAAFFMNTETGSTGKINPVESIKQIDVDLPVGFVANPMLTPRCPRAEWEYCGGDNMVGFAGYELNEFGQGHFGARTANVLPPKGAPAQLTFQTLTTKATVIGKLRPDDYGVKSVTSNITTNFKFYNAFVTLWGQPGDPSLYGQRCPSIDESEDCDDPGSTEITGAFLTNPTECTGQPVSTLIGTFSWESSSVLANPVASDSPPVTDCESVPFEPATSVSPTSTQPDSASGIDFDVTVPQDGLVDPDGIATSHLKDVTVDLPEGVSVNPSAATGLEGCSDAQMQQGSDAAPTCPDGSKIGTVSVTSPLVDREIGGTMYLGTPKSTDPMSGEMLRLWVVARNDDLGIMIKLPGSATADPSTGKLTATFENNPRIPFDRLSVDLKGGDRGVLATPQRCGSRAMQTTLTPWSGTAPVTQSTTTDYTGDCTFGFAPTLAAGMDNQQGRGGGTFSFRFARPQGDQTLSGLTAKLPQGLLASVKDVPLCTGAQAASGSCPAVSKIGLVDAKAGSGDPFVLEQKGEVFLTEGYKGGAYGLAVKIRPVAGPFRGDMELSPIIVRQALHVDRTTAEVTAVSDPFPQIHHGVPLRVREVTVLIDRGGFMLNPSDCSAKQIDAAIVSAQGTVANRSVPFQATGCSSLPFKPTLKLALTGRKQVKTGKHPGVKAVVTQAGTSEAGIERVEVRLPKSLALDPENAQALCEYEDGTKPDLENRCPKGSIVGRAKATTPLLAKPLTGNVYFVKNVRIDPKTGNTIRTLPMIVVALRGEIAVNLRGESSTTKSGKLVNTFANIPDAPISQFNLNIRGGNTGILAVTRTRKAKINLCTGRHTAETDMDAQNGRRHDLDVRMKTPCTKKQTKAAKLHAKRAAAKANRR